LRQCRIVRRKGAAAFPGQRFTIDHNPVYTANLMGLIGHFSREVTLAIFRPWGANSAEKGATGFKCVAGIPPHHWPALQH